MADVSLRLDERIQGLQLCEVRLLAGPVGLGRKLKIEALTPIT